MSKILAQWKLIASAAGLQRSSQSFSVVGSRGYVFGGELRPREPRDSGIHIVEVESPQNASIETIERDPRPTPRVGAESAVLGEQMYLFSGRGGVAMAPIEEFGALWRFTPKTASWAKIAPADAAAPYPPARSYHCCTSDDKSKLFIHAGCPETGRLSDFWSFDTAVSAWTELAPAPAPPRGGTSIAHVNSKIYRMGGFDGKHELGGEIDIYDVAANSWSTHRFEPDGVSGPGHRSVAALLALRVQGKMSLVTLFGERDPSSLGHQGAGKMLGDVWLWDIESRTWSPVLGKDKIPASRGWFAADVLKRGETDAVVVQGGLGETNDRHDDLWLLSFE
ncbi:kelch repeat protein-like protein [Mycena galopus ATCC 62051]|nr:kelch repeat protein-like protein [Mycena galopus ATCC 62051]